MQNKTNKTRKQTEEVSCLLDSQPSESVVFLTANKSVVFKPAPIVPELDIFQLHSPPFPMLLSVQRG